MVIKIAITGNIASGKSQVEKYLANKNFPVYDTDKIAHKVLDEIKEFYGYDVFTNEKIDRKKLGNLVFKNPEIKKKLESIVHPKVKSEINNLFEKHKSDKYIFISVPLLFEAKFENMFDKILCVAVNAETQLKRLMERNSLTKEEALLRINSQTPQEEKIKKADYVIHNNSTIENLHNQLSKLF